MDKNILIVDERDVFRFGLIESFSEHIATKNIYEASTHETMLEYLRTEVIDLIFIHQSLIVEIELFSKVSFVVLALKPDIEILTSSYTAGAKGYLLETAAIELFCATLRLPEGAFLIDPLISSYLLGQLYKNPVITIDHTVLTAREQEVLDLLRDGVSKEEIAVMLNISIHTLKTHMKNITQKVGRPKLMIYVNQGLLMN